MTARIKFSLAIASCAAVVPAPATVIPAPTGIPRLSETPVRGPAPCGKSFRHSKSDHFPATTQLAQSDHRTKISYENILSSYDRGPIASYESTGAESTNTPPPSRGTSHPDTNRPHLPSLLPPNSEHQSLSGSKLIIGPLGTPKQPTTAYTRIRTPPLFWPKIGTPVPIWFKATIGTRSATSQFVAASRTSYPPREGEALLGVKE